MRRAAIAALLPAFAAVALTHAEAANRIAPEMPGIASKVVRCLLAQGKVPEASAWTTAWLASHPGDADRIVNAGLVALLTGHREEAIAHFERAVALRPGDAAARRALSRARESAR